MRLRTAFYILLCALPLMGGARAFNRYAVADSLDRVLAESETPGDSAVILSDMFDVVARQHRDSIGTMAFHSAVRAGDSRLALDLLRNLANTHLRNDSLLQVDFDRAMRFESSDDRSATVAFIRMLHNSYKVRYATPQEQDKQIIKLLKELNVNPEGDIYQQIVRLHALCLYIGACSQGELLSGYISQLGDLVNQLPDFAYAIKNCYHVQASLAFMQNEEYDKAVDSDRKLLACIDRLDSDQVGMKRKFRDYDSHRYVIYTRLLANYPRLKDAEVEEYYHKAMDIAGRDELAKQTNMVSGRPQIFYAMYKKDYPAALELLDKYGHMPYNAHIRRQMLAMTIESANATGDKDKELTAFREYSSILEQTLESRMVEKYKELEIVYNLHKLKAEHARGTWQLHKKMLTVAGVAAGILFILLVLVALLWRHAKKLAEKISKANADLRVERDNLKKSQYELVKARDEARQANRIKSDFIRNMSSEVSVPLHTINEYTNLIVDCSEAGVKSYLKHFADLVTQNAEVLTTIISDVMSLSEIDGNSLVIEKRKEHLRHLCEVAVDSVLHKGRPGVVMKLAEGLPDLPVTTDPHRLLQILVQLLKNAAKFTEEGLIEVDYAEDSDGGLVSISVTDTGIGISPENSERIFERFVKLDSNSPGIGIGLTIARHLAELLGGSLELDSTYTDGARFVVKIPID